MLKNSLFLRLSIVIIPGIAVILYLLPRELVATSAMKFLDAAGYYFGLYAISLFVAAVIGFVCYRRQIFFYTAYLMTGLTMALNAAMGAKGIISDDELFVFLVVGAGTVVSLIVVHSSLGKKTAPDTDKAGIIE